MGCSSSKVESIGPVNDKKYIGHLEGTTHHKTLVSWKEYYQENIDLRKENGYENVPCPCKTDVGNTVHNLVPSSNSNPIGAHVYYIDKDGYITFGIILTCNGCNTGSKKFVSTCKMLTMINCPQVKCVPFDATLRNENLDNYTYENNKFDFQKSVQTRKSKITDDKEQYRYGEKNYYKIEKKSGNYINFIII